MFERLKAKLKKRVYAVRSGYVIRPSGEPGTEYLCYPDGLRLIIEDGKYVGFYTQEPCDR